MKYIVTESQYKKINQISVEHLKEPMFKYWDVNGGKDLKTTMKLFNIPPAGSTLIQEWLLEWMGGEEEVMKMLDRYTGRIMDAVEGTYDFKFYLSDLRMYTHTGVGIYFDATANGEGKVDINHNGHVYDNIYDAHLDEDIGWEVDDEIRDIIRDTIDMIIPVEFEIYIDRLGITQPGQFNN